MNQSRSYCQSCSFPSNTCVCSAIGEINNRTHIDVMQYPSEAKASKNTVKLCVLCLTNIKVWQGENDKDFCELRQSLETDKEDCWVIYPTEQSVELSEASNKLKRPKRIVIIDGTWRKAYKIFQLNPWLKRFPLVSLNPEATNYEIRKAPKPGQLSSLECVLEALNSLEPETDTTPIKNTFSLFKSHFLSHKQRSNQA